MPSLLDKELASQALEVEFIECFDNCCDARSRKSKHTELRRSLGARKLTGILVTKLRGIVERLRLLDAVVGTLVQAESSPDNPEPAMSKAAFLRNGFMGTYSEIEGILITLLDYYGINVDHVSDPIGDAFAFSVLEAFDDVENPLNEVLGTKHCEGLTPLTVVMPTVRYYIDVVRRYRTRYRSQCLVDPRYSKAACITRSYEPYYIRVLEGLVTCLGICMVDTSEMECSASCKAKEDSEEQGMTRSKHTFVCEGDPCGRQLDTTDNLEQHVSTQHQADSPTNTTKPGGVEQPFEAGFATEELAHAKLLGITVQASVEAKATASQLRISDRLRALMEEVPTSRTGTGQQPQEPARRASTRPYRVPPPFQAAKTQENSTAKSSAGGTTTSPTRFSKLDEANDTTKKTRVVDTRARSSDSRSKAPLEQLSEATRSDQAHLKPHIAQLKDVGPTSLPSFTENVDVQSEQLTEPATNSTPLQKVLADLSFHQSLLAKARQENAALIQERDDLKSKLLRVYEEQAASFKTKDDLAKELRRGFNAVMDDLLRST